MKAKAGRAQLRELEGHGKDASFYSDQWALAKLGLGKAHLVLCVCVCGGVVATSTSAHLPLGPSQVLQEEAVIGQGLG